MQTLSKSLALALVSICMCVWSGDALSANELKSAYLGPSVWDEDLSSQEVNQQLREHFAEVITRLEAKNASSLLTALMRAEATSAKRWTKADRRAALIYLMRNRQQQIDRVRDYMTRGLFPLNQGESPNAVPIFVDRHDTHCAVGYLMHSDGKDSEVASIVSADNLVRIMNVRGGGMIQWIRTSGLTQEEAAMIQPTYALTPDATFETLQTQELRQDGLVVSDIQVRGTRFNVNLPSNIAADPQIVQDALAIGKAQLDSNNVVGLPFLQSHGVVVNEFNEPFTTSAIPPPDNLTDWLFFGPDNAFFGELVGSAQSTGNVGLLSIEYTLEAESGVIDQFALTSVGNDFGALANSVSGEQAAILLLTEILDPATDTLIDTVSLSAFGGAGPLGSLDPILVGSDATPVGRTSVRLSTHLIGLAGGSVAGAPSTGESVIGNFFHEVSVQAVPEPSSSALVVFAIGAATLRRSRVRFSSVS